MRIASIVTPLLAGALITALFGSSVRSQQTVTPAAADWPMYRHDYSGTGYSPLTQINTKNVSSLTESWAYRLGTENSQATPIVINGSMYLPIANGVVALEPETGKERWRYVLSGAAPSRRGVSFWPGDSGNPRVIFTAGRRLIALDATTGQPAPSFGKDGEVDIVVPYNSVPLVYKNVVVVGANNPPGPVRVPGNARAFDARTGAKLWEFSSVAQPGSVGHDTWEGDSWKGRAGANAWPFYFTLDAQRGLLYLPLASPIPGGYGGDRKGANLYGNSVVAVDIQTGEYKWHFQTIHHDLWDADPPAPPGLFDIMRNGRRLPVMALTTKSGYMYILHRENGRPIFGVEERAVPGSDVPGEAAFPTQPIPVKPPPLARNAYKPEDLVSAGGHNARTRGRVQGARQQPRRRLQCRTVHAVEISRDRIDDANFSCVPWRTWWRELGRNGVRSRLRVRLRRNAGRRNAWLGSKSPGWRADRVREDRSATRHVRRTDCQ